MSLSLEGARGRFGASVEDQAHGACEGRRAVPGNLHTDSTNGEGEEGLTSLETRTPMVLADQ